MSFDDILRAVNGKVALKGIYDGFNKISTDTRKIEKDDIFIALKGENFDGNNYVKQASEKGACMCIVDKIKFEKSDICRNTTVVEVRDTGKALLDLAEFYRSILDIKVVGITGSVGKTSTKDLVAAALSGKFRVFKTEGNFNNEIGLPHMIFKLDNSYDIAVLEMGMNGLGEIHNMAKAARPDVALITNIGTAHIGKLKSRENILKAKMEITDFFSEKNVLVVNADNDMLSKIKNNTFPYKLRTVAMNEKSNISAFNVKVMEESVEFYVKENNRITEEKITAAVPGKHSVMNALFAVCTGRIFNLGYDEIRDGFKKLETTKMRLEIIHGKKFSIINDSYNANPDSMIAALDVLEESSGKRKIAVLGTMNELGEDSEKLHKKIGEYASKKNIDLLAVLGVHKEDYRDGFESFKRKKNEGKVVEFRDYESLVKFLKEKYIQKNDVILVKASRSMKFENIVLELKKGMNN